MAKRNRKIDEVFPILAIEDGIIISKNGDITVPYELTMPEIYTISVADYDRMHQVFSRALQSVDTNTIIHKQDWYLVEKYEPLYNKYPDSEVKLNWTDEQHFSERECLNHRCFLFITRPMDPVLKRKSSQSSLLSPRLIPRQILDPAYRNSILEVAEQFVNTLAESNLFTSRRLSDDEIDYQLTSESIYQQYFTLKRDDLALTDIELGAEFKVNGQFCSLTAIGDLSEFPVEITNSKPIDKFQNGKHTISGSLGYRVGMSLPFNHIYNQLFYVDNREKLLKQLEGEANRMSSFSLNSRQNEQNLEYKLQFIKKAMNTGGKVIRMHANVLTWHSDREKMLTQRSEVNAGFSNMGFSPRNAVSDASVLYWSCIPGNGGEIGKENLAICFAEEGTCLLALENNYRDLPHNKLGVKLTDRLGAPKSVDIFIGPNEKGVIDNRNAVIVAPSGGGKSFLMNLMAYHLLEQGSDVLLVDTGHSYKRLCSLMKGVYITFDKDNPLSFNPFYFDKRELTADEIEDSKQTVIQLLLSLWKSETESITNSEEVGIENLVHSFYAYLEDSRAAIYPCFNSFFDYFKDVYYPMMKDSVRDKDIDLPNFRFVMQRFYKDGHFGYLLNAGPDNQINRLLDERFVVFEMDNIKDNRTLQTVTTIAIMSLYVRKLMRKNRAVFNMLVIEEAWRLVKDPRFAKFLQWVSKTARKHLGSLVSVTQEPGDLMSPLVQDALIKNSAIKILLDFSQYKNQAKMVQDVLALSDDEIGLLMSVNKGKDPNLFYKEVFISWNGYAKVYRTEVGSYSYAAYTSKKKEVHQIEKLKEKHGSYARALTGFARGEHQRKPLVHSVHS